MKTIVPQKHMNKTLVSGTLNRREDNKTIYFYKSDNRSP